jgi:hypothetical protein
LTVEIREILHLIIFALALVSPSAVAQTARKTPPSIGVGARGTVLTLRVPINGQEEQLASDSHQQIEASHE